MKKIFLAIFCFICFGVINSLSAQEANNTSAVGNDYKTAVGIRLSNNAPIVGNAITLKHFLNEKTAIEGFFSFSDPLSLGALLEIQVLVRVGPRGALALRRHQHLGDGSRVATRQRARGGDVVRWAGRDSTKVLVNAGGLLPYSGWTLFRSLVGRTGHRTGPRHRVRP